MSNVRSKKMIAYHFISEKYALEAVSKQRLKLSLLNDLNDPFELLAADLPDRESREEANRFKNYMASNLGILCFSKSWKNPLLWSHYADRHKGIALICHIKDSIALPVNYRKNRFVFDMKGKRDKKLKVTHSETEGLWLTKFESWRYEDEVRMICSKSECKNEDELFFKYCNPMEFQFKGLILGALCNLSLDKIKDALPKGKEIDVIKSRLAFRSFEIVQQREFKPKVIRN